VCPNTFCNFTFIKSHQIWFEKNYKAYFRMYLECLARISCNCSPHKIMPCQNPQVSELYLVPNKEGCALR
jgi:hypothetical protein